MTEILNQLFSQTVSLFAIIDVAGVSLMLLSMLPKNSANEDINTIAFKTTMTTIVSFFVVLITGNMMLKLFGISIHSLKVMGGVVLILTALKMVNGTQDSKNQTQKEAEEVKSYGDFSVIPLGIPITFGPGLFAATVIYKNESQNFADVTILILAFMINAFVLYFGLRYSVLIKKYLGITGQKIIERLMGLVVGAIAVEFMVSGVNALWR